MYVSHACDGYLNQSINKEQLSLSFSLCPKNDKENDKAINTRKRDTMEVNSYPYI